MLAMYKQNVSISFCLSDSVHFRAWMLYFSLGTNEDVNIYQLLSSRMYKVTQFINILTLG